MNVPIVTLTTDWGDRDHYAAMVKGRLCSLIPGVSIVDLSHSQNWDSLAVAARIIKFGCLSFPAGTVHVIDFCEDLSVKSVGKSTYTSAPLLAQCKGHYFLCENRKLLEVSLDAECDSLVVLPLPSAMPSDVFVTWGLFCDVAAMLVNGAKPSELGEPAIPLTHREFLRAQFDGTTISARPDIIDKYGNVTLNLRYVDFVEYRAGRRFRVELEFQVGSIEQLTYVTDISRNYCCVKQGEILLTVSSTGHLQLAMNQGSLEQLMGINYSTVCRFVFLG